MSAWALHTELDLEAVNVHLAALQRAGLLGISEERGRATAYFRAHPGALPITGRWEELADRDWNEVWRRGVEPVTVGALTIAPPWMAAPGPSTIVIEPGQAFGTGHHESTAGCLAALSELDVRGRRVLDVGTGSGILAVAAARLGAGAVVAVDTDPVAVAAAAAGARANGVPVTVRLGSVEEAPGTYDVVLANLDTTTLVALATALAARLHDGGTLVASGVAVERRDEAVAALRRAGLSTLERRGREWVVLLGRAPVT